MLSEILQAFRSFGRNRTFTFAVILTFGLGIAANSAIYSYMRALVHEPILVPELDRVIIAAAEHPRRPGDLTNIAPVDFLDWRDNARTLERVSAWSGFDAVINGEGVSESVIAHAVSHTYFGALGAEPLIGRTFLPQEDAPGADDVVILAERFWRRRLGADPGITGRTFLLNNRTVRIAGVMRGDQIYPPDAELFVPLALSETNKREHGPRYLEVIARMKPGVTLSQVRAELAVLAEGARRRYPDSHGTFHPLAGQLSDYFSGPDTPRYLRFSLLASGFLLLLATATAANLQFARVSGRWRELAIRTALGSSHWLLARQVLVESLLLTAGGVAAGVLLAGWSIEALRNSLPAEVERFLPAWRRVHVDARALGFTIAISTLAGLLAGAAAIAGGLRIQPADVMRGGAQGGRQRLRAGLVVVQVALAVMLLTGASVMRRGVGEVSQPRPGMEAGHVLAMKVLLDRDRYASPAKISQLQSDLAAKASALPGVTHAAIATDIPYEGGRFTSPVEVEGDAPTDRVRRASALTTMGLDAFSILRIPLRQGRLFDASDTSASGRVAIANEAFVRQFFGSVDPMSRRVKIDSEWRTIVGVVADTRHMPFDRNVLPVLYRPASQAAPRRFELLLRTGGDPAKLSSTARGLLQDLDPAQPSQRILPYSTIIDNQVNGLHWAAWILGVIGSLALILSAGGIYSVMAFVVSGKTREIGIRMALGAREKTVAFGVTRSSIRLTAWGLLIGCPGALALVQSVAHLIHGVSPLDPASWARVLALLIVTAVVASAVPALRAARVDPVIALRSE